MTVGKEKRRIGREFAASPFYGRMVKLPLVRIPLPGCTLLLWFVSDVGLVPQSITIWNVYDSPMSALVKLLLITLLFNICPGVRVITDDVSVNGAPFAPSTALICTWA